jgi:hypothetical protein
MSRVRALLALALATACATADLDDEGLRPPLGQPAPLVDMDEGTDTATPAEPDGPAPVVVTPGEVSVRLAPPEHSQCGEPGAVPELPDGDDGSDKRTAAQVTEESDKGLPVTRVDGDALIRASAPTRRTPRSLEDPDADCLTTAEELAGGTDPDDPDSDGDGWLDGPCNERWQLYVERITANDEQEDIGEDELYLIADDVRHPSPDLDGSWDFDDGDTLSMRRLLATRVRGVSSAGFLPVTVEGWEDDFELIGDWSVDDYLFGMTIDVGAHGPGERFTLNGSGEDDWDYDLVFSVEVERFADPDPRADGDSDADGIDDSDEARVAADLGGLTDPLRADVLVELDWMSGRALRTEAKRQVVTQLARNGITLRILRDEELPNDPCLSVPEAKTLYATRFRYRAYDAFRYAIMTETIWNDRSGVAWGDIFLVDASTWWIGDMILPQAGTFIHELGHTLGLTNRVFRLIDSTAWLSYDSAMNYTFQAIKVDYSSDGDGGDSSDHDDWSRVNPAEALRWSFGLVDSVETGVCR